MEIKKEQLIDSLIIYCSYSKEEAIEKLKTILGKDFETQELFPDTLPSLIVALD